MRFFKYLIFLLIFFSVSANATFFTNLKIGETLETASGHSYVCRHWGGTTYYDLTNNNTILNCRDVNWNILFTVRIGTASCWHPDYKIVQQSVKSQVKKTICIPNN